MKIDVKDKSTGATKVAVRVVKPVWSMSDDELIKALDLKEKILDWHYRVEDRYHEVSDIYSDSLVEFVAEEVDSYCQDPEFDGAEEIAKRLIGKLEDEIVEEIYSQDDDAVEEYREIEEARKGQY